MEIHSFDRRKFGLKNVGLKSSMENCMVNKYIYEILFYLIKNIYMITILQ